MTDGSNEMKPRTWTAASVAALLIAIAIGLILFWYTEDAFNAIWAILIVFGAYMAAMSGFRPKEEEGFGPSPADATAAGGILLVGIGLAGLSYSFIGEVILTVVVLILFIALTGAFMAYKNRGI